ncbi:Transcriptional protein [Dirofilaria immitis]
MSKKKKEIHVSGLLEPWKAYYSNRRKRIFYFNMETKQTTWEMPAVENPRTESDLSTKQLDTKYQQGTSDIQKKEDVSYRNLVPMDFHGSKEPDIKSTSNKLDDYLHGLNVTSTSEPNEELMEVDETSMEEISCHEEPMEVDFVVGEVQAFRREHFLSPNRFASDKAQFSHAAKYTRLHETTENAGMVLIVFDTSCLLQDTTLLPMCIQRTYCSLIPYTVLQELDSLKKAKSGELRSKAMKTIAYLHDCVKRGCNYLFIENTFEASDGMEEFGCQNNDDIILKCAFINTRKYDNERIRVVFATNDKNLAVKAAAHNIVTADRNELLHLLTTNPTKDKNQPFTIRNTSQKVSPSDFSFVTTDKPSSSVVDTKEITAFNKVVDRLLAPPLEYDSSSLSFTLVPEKGKISSHNSTSSVAVSGKIKNEFRNSVCHKKESYGISSSVEQRGIHHPRPAPYSIRKDIGSGGRSFMQRKLCQLNEYSMNDFLEIFAKLIEYLLQRRSDRKSIEDTRRISKVIDSVIANESFSLNVLVDLVSKFYDFYADRDVFVSAIHFDKRKLINEYESTTSIVKEKLLTFQKQLLVIHSHTT